MAHCIRKMIYCIDYPRFNAFKNLFVESFGLPTKTRNIFTTNNESSPKIKTLLKWEQLKQRNLQ